MRNVFRLARLIGVLSIILVFAFIPVIAAYAAPETGPVFQDQAPVTLPDLVRTLETLGGVAMFFAAVINVGKKTGKISDGQAPAWSLGLNALGLVTLVGLQLTGKFDLVPMLDTNAGALATAINAILALIFQLYASRKTHEAVLAGIPVVGESHSGRRAGEGPAMEVGLAD